MRGTRARVPHLPLLSRFHETRLGPELAGHFLVDRFGKGEVIAMRIGGHHLPSPGGAADRSTLYYKVHLEGVRAYYRQVEDWDGLGQYANLDNVTMQPPHGSDQAGASLTVAMTFCAEG
jgi:hypothetical protein